MTEKLLATLSLEEKIAQLCAISVQEGDLLPDGSLSERLLATFKTVGVGAIQLPFRNCTPKESAIYANSLQKAVQEHTDKKIPILVHEECLHGQMARGATSFPIPIALGCSWDTDLVYRIFQSIGKETRNRGGHQAFTPVVDLGRDPRWGRIEETFGEDTYLVGSMGVAAVQGMQGLGKERLNQDHIAATLKHFAGYAQSDGGRNFGPSHITKRVLQDQIFPPFQRAVTEGQVAGIMPSHNDIDGIPCHANRELLNDILRDQWGFDGVVVSDYHDVSRLEILYHIAQTEEEAAQKALLAGVTLDLPRGENYRKLLPLLQENPNPALLEAVDDAVLRVLQLKEELGLFKNPFVDEKRAVSIVNSAEHKRIAYEAATKSTVLLKNDGALPLQKDSLKSIALIGPYAKGIQLGAYSPKPNQGISIYQGLRKALPAEVSIQCAPGCGITNEQSHIENELDISQWVNAPSLPERADELESIAVAVELAQQTDIAIVCVGGNDLTSREAIFFGDNYGDRAHLELVGQQEELILEVAKVAKKVVVVLVHGRPLITKNWSHKVHAIVDAWYPGQEGGAAIADILLGKVNPSGKLCVSIPRSVGHLPVYYSQKPTGTFKGYLFEENTPLYPFGFGLSYTTFAYNSLCLKTPTVSITELTAGASITVSVHLTNTGSCAGEEISQLYITPMQSSVTRPAIELKGFTRTLLQPGETKEAQFTLDAEAFMYTAEDYTTTIDAGVYQIKVGGSSVEWLMTKLILE